MNARQSIRFAFVLATVLFLPVVSRARSQRPANPSAPAAGAAQAEGRPPVVHLARLAIETHRLANGLEVVTLENHRVPVVNLQVWYHVGSKDERPGRVGFAHLFEHLMARGSAHLSSGEHARIIKQLGGLANAYTTDDATVFSDTFPSRYLARVLWMEADRMGSLDVSRAKFLAARRIVARERRENLEGQPYGLVTEDLYAAAFRFHPYHHITIGPMDDLEKATLAEVRDFYRTYYRPNNATLVIVGDFSTREALAWGREYFGGIPPSPNPIPRVTVKEPPQTSPRRLTRSYANSPFPGVVEAFRVPPRFSPDQYPLVLASAILSQGASARLRRSLMGPDPIALQVFGAGNFTEDPNLFFVGAILAPGHAASDAERAIDAIVEKMRNTPVTPAELARARNQTIAHLVESRETDRGLGDQIGEAAVVGHDPALVNRELGRYLRVSAADIERVSREYFIARRATVLLIESPGGKQPSRPPGF